MIVWQNREFIEEAAAGIGITDRGLTLGDGVFDTLLALDGVPQEGAAHFARLQAHAQILGMAIDTAQFERTAQDLLARNQFTKGRHAVRTTATRGPGKRGLMVPADPAYTLLMRASPVPTAGGPVRLITATSVRRNEGSPLSRIKSLNYGDNILALMEARAHGADDALMLNNAGNAACASAANIYVQVGDDVLTPPLADGAMDGIVRARLIAQGFAREQTITAAMLAQCGGMMVSNSTMGVRPVVAFNGRDLEPMTGPAA
ncbi:MAG: aminotransferase class IV [Alphaproteobacteria bacterium]|nr:aminotransferase class IV [Alphaproteobacteria bacterium]